MGDAGLVVEDAPNPVAAKITNHRIVPALGKALDSVADIAQGGAGFYHLDAAHHGLVGGFHQPPRLDTYLAHVKGAAGIAVPAVENGGDVDVDDIAFS